MEKMGWQPIETVPNGEDVLLFVPKIGVVIAMQCGEENDVPKYLDWNAYDPGTPTHWMPLPDPPINS
jgi:hypothetical protein